MEELLKFAKETNRDRIAPIDKSLKKKATGKDRIIAEA